MSKLFGAMALALVATAGQAQTVYNTSLAPLNTATATTTTDATGTRTTTTADSTAPGSADTWFQANVRPGGTVGITTDYAHDGNGSAYFETEGASGTAKGDLQFVFDQPLALSDLQSISYDYFRDASSTTMATLAPVMRLDIEKDGQYAGSLVFENYYQHGGNAVVGDWTTVTATLNSGVIWATNSALGPKNAAADGGEKTFAEWLAGNSGAALTVTGMSIGVGSGWTGSFKGAVDDVSVDFANGPHTTYNFEVAGGVPEPASWAMMVGGFGLVGGAMRRRKTAIRFA